MKVNAQSYPHPVLGNADDIKGMFDVEFKYELGKEKIVLNPRFVLRNAVVEQLIREEKASFVVEVECSSTFFRQGFSTRNPFEKFEIPARRVRERVAVGFFVCADQDIEGYAPSECHPDYAGETFDLERGDVLAFGGYCFFTADKEFDPLRPPVSSFMAIDKGASFEGPMEIEYEADKITVLLSKTDWGFYLAVRNNKLAEGILHSAIVLPVLVDAIHQVRKPDSGYERNNWFARLESILDAQSLNKTEPFTAAQKILENPSARSLHGIGGLLDISDSEDYE